MAGGGSKPGVRRGGRQHGTKNRATIERETRALEGVAAVAETGLMPLDVILRVMREGFAGSSITPDQYMAARDAAPFLHPRQSAVAHTTVDDLQRLTDAQVLAEIARLGATQR